MQRRRGAGLWPDDVADATREGEAPAEPGAGCGSPGGSPSRCNPTASDDPKSSGLRASKTAAIIPRVNPKFSPRQAGPVTTSRASLDRSNGPDDETIQSVTSPFDPTQGPIQIEAEISSLRGRSSFWNRDNGRSGSATTTWRFMAVDGSFGEGLPAVWPRATRSTTSLDGNVPPRLLLARSRFSARGPGWPES
jgi:hypothetical protein